MLLRELFDDRYMAEATAGESFCGHVHSSIKAFERYLGHPPTLADLTDEAINRFLKDLQEIQKLSIYTVKQRRSDLNGLWKFAWRKGLIDHEPRDLRKIRIPHRIPRAWTIEQMQWILAACEHPAMSRCWPNGIPRGQWFNALIRVIYDSLLRSKDALALEIDQLQPDGSFTVIQSKTDDEIVCRLRPSTVEAIQAIFPPDRQKIFEGPANRQRVIWHYNKLLRLAGLPDGRRNGLQKIRRTGASHLEAVDKGAASWALGHRDPTMARRHYLDPQIITKHVPLAPPISGNPADNVTVVKPQSAGGLPPAVEGGPAKRGPDFRKFTVRRYFERYYRPEALGDKRPKTIERTIWAINRFNEFIGATATIGELKPEILDLFVADAVAQGYTPETYSRYRCILTRIATHAALRKGNHNAESDELLEKSLRWYFEQHFLPEFLADKSSNTRWRYQTSIAAFDKFNKRCLMLTEITEAKLECFWRHLMETGAKESTANKYVKQVRTIWQHAYRRAMAEGEAAA